MTQEDKDLVLKDLCARLPYGVKVQGNFRYRSGEDIVDDVQVKTFENNDIDWLIHGIEIKPYLRPMSSMTEEEKKEYEKLCILIPTQFDSDFQKYDYYTTDSMESFDWLLKNHFDVRDLIEKGLAIAVSEENNPYKE